ncbi:hypothetical protein Q7P37_005648 [Cladosporium fusiforme]
MSSSLLALLSQQTPNLPTRKGLILTGLQHDFLSADGKLPVSNLGSGFLDRTKGLINAFRGHGDVIWIRTETEGLSSQSDLDGDDYNIITSSIPHDRLESDESSDADDASDTNSDPLSKKRKPGNGRSSRGGESGSSKRKQTKASHDDELAADDSSMEVDDEYFLTRTDDREPCFMKGSAGADYAEAVKSAVHPTDLQVIKNYYSAFSSTSLLLTLRSKLITELYICGAMTNLNVYATSMDAARYGIKITLVEDCLGYRKRERHDLAIKSLVDIMDADVMTSDEVVTAIGGRLAAQIKPQAAAGGGFGVSDNSMLSGMLEVGSSDEEDQDDDLLPVRASPYMSHRPLEIRGTRPMSKNLQDIDTDDRSTTQPPQLRCHAPAESTANRDNAQRETQDISQRTCESKTFEFEGKQAASQPSLVLEDPAELAAEKQQTERTIEKQTSPSAFSHDNQLSQTSTLAAVSQATRTKKHHATSKPRRRNRRAETSDTVERQSWQPLFGVGKEEDSASSSIRYDLLPPDRVDGLFHRLKDEVKWQRMHHQTGAVPRLVCCQGTVGSDGSMPIYRHPSDETLALDPWTPAVDEIRRAAEALVGHTLNHALIQLYRSGTDLISEHSDKTLDIAPDSFIVNASFGAERVMRLRTKRNANPANTSPTCSDEPRPRTTYRVRLPHNSALLMSLTTNAQYLHSINADKRPAVELTAAEKAYDAQRISLTFRQIETFIDSDSRWIWGQGATGNFREDAKEVINGHAVETDKLLKGFGAENAGTEVRWEEWYGGGSDVLHMK